MDRHEVDALTLGGPAASRRGRLELVSRADRVVQLDLEEPEELNLRVVQPLFSYVREHHGEAVLARILDECGVPAALLRRSSSWVSLDRVERLLASVRELVGSDQAFLRACVHEMKKIYGPMVLVLRCMTVRAAYDAMARTSHLASKISRFEVIGGTRTSVKLRYTSTRKESRLLCLSRQAQQRYGPTLWWGIGPGKLEEKSCIAHGDPACEYHIRWREPLRWRRGLIGAAAGTAAATILAPALAPAVAFALLPIMGFGAGMLLELRRMVDDYLQFSEETSSEMECVVEAHAKAVDELLALHHREREWSNRLEASMAERSAKIDVVLSELDAAGRVRKDKLRSLSHDLNNPLTVLSTLVGHLHQSQELQDPQNKEALEAIHLAVQRTTVLVRELSRIVREDADEDLVRAEPIEVSYLSDLIRRQLRATLAGRDVRVSVFTTREAPGRISAPALVLERILDNLLTNACKYTERGSIVVEISGRPGYLVLKISDTGRGMGPERLERVFRGGSPDPRPMIGESTNLGIPIVVKLLDQLNGRLEIMSDPGVGTTIWVHVPVDPTPKNVRLEDTADSMLERVVKIRPRPS